MDELAEALGIGYQTASADIDEQAIRDPEPRRLVLKLAHAKAEAIKARLASDSGGAPLQGVLITCDQVGHRKPRRANPNIYTFGA